jgi:glycosyltransferase involved in cell wall biosynthesis
MKISIITVIYNGANTIADTIESVYNQTYNNIEYLIIDGKSSDNSIDVIKRFEEAFYNSGISYKWISEEDDGLYDAINKGINMSTGDVIGILNSDDFFSDNLVVNDIAIIFENEKVDCIYGNINYINPITSKVMRKWKSKQYEDGLFDKSWTPAHPTFYCKKEVYQKYGLYRTDFKIAADVELMYRFLVRYKVKSKYLERLMVIMRMGGISNNGLNSTLTITKEMIKVYKENGKNLNLIKYLIYKFLKLKEFIVK